MSLTPDPVPTAAQKVTLAEIVMLSVDDVETMITSESTQEIADAKWARTRADIDAWSTIGDDGGEVKRVGNIEFFENKTVDARLAFRNKIRQRYGYEPLSSETESERLAVASGTWF